MGKAPIKYKTKGFECWQKAKELRITHYLEIARAKEEGKIAVTGCGTVPFNMLAGFGDFAFLSGEPYGASVSWDIPFSRKAMETFEARGYACDPCAYMRNYCGSMFMDKYYFTGGPFPKFDFVWSTHYCPVGHPKWSRG